ncbi:Bax inhibitor-1/YccA family protein [Geotalea sp. SG265]|uniref:Bax inhibitor-1/YccA family protein n=1 Tax=Geotalea sp. SG265 TaxID=2922867 RepID=UPI001FAEBAA3|nr:Bax inhibitor-1/YccA family protein [Geotalea sp. SG265]
MEDFNINYPRTADQVAIAQNTLIRQVYAWMAGGLFVTALLAVFTISSPAMLNVIFGNRLVFYALILGELGLVVAISGAINRLSSAAASGLFLLYAALNGVTMSAIFAVYTAESIGSTFVITAATFGTMSIYGTVTKRDLSGWGSFLFMGLIGIVIASVVNIFTKSSAASWIISAIGVIVFTGLTAYDTWKIKAMAAGGAHGRKPAILGALTLYLDFINLFLMLLRLLGNRR